MRYKTILMRQKCEVRNAKCDIFNAKCDAKCDMFNAIYDAKCDAICDAKCDVRYAKVLSRVRNEEQSFMSGITKQQQWKEFWLGTTTIQHQRKHHTESTLQCISHHGNYVNPAASTNTTGIPGVEFPSNFLWFLLLLCNPHDRNSDAINWSINSLRPLGCFFDYEGSS